MKHNHVLMQIAQLFFFIFFLFHLKKNYSYIETHCKYSYNFNKTYYLIMKLIIPQRQLNFLTIKNSRLR